MSALHARAVADAAALVTRVDADLRSFVEGLTTQIEGLAKPAADVEALQTQLRERETQNQELRTLLVKARMDLEAARADLAAERESTDTIRADAAQLTGEFDRALDEMRREHVTVLAEQSAVCTTLPLDELLTVFNALKKAETGNELLSALLSGLAREFSRVALFHVDGTRLVAAERHGFADEDTSKPIKLPADSLLTRAVSTGRLESLMPSLRGEPHTSLPFGGTPGCALAIPIVVQGATAAVIYADDSDHVEFATAAPQVRVKFAELIQQYALLVLLRISVETKSTVERKSPVEQNDTDGRKSAGELRAFAASLVAELEYTYTVEAEAGRNRLECEKRLKDGLQKARRRYAEKAGGDADAAGLLDEQLASTLAARKESAFGRDLAALMAARPRGARAGHTAAIR